MSASAPPAAEIVTPSRRETLTRRVVILAVLAGLFLRLAFALTYWVGKPLTQDESEYLALAASLAEGQGLHYGTGPGSSTVNQIGRAPLYPAFLASLAIIDPRVVSRPTEAPATVKIAQSVLGAVIIWLVSVLATRAAGPIAGAVASVIAAVYPPMIWISSYVLSETLFSLLALASAHLLDRAIQNSWYGPKSDRSSTFYGLLAGLSTGAAALTRPTMLIFLACAIVWLIRHQRTNIVLALTIGALLPIAPWTLRNFREHGRFVLIAPQGGVTFWTGNHPLSPGEGDLAANPALKRANLELRGDYPGLSPEELESIYYREAFRHIAEDPLWWLGLEARKFFYTWIPIGPSYLLHSPRYFLATIVSYGLLLPFAVVGFFWLRRTVHQPHAMWLLAVSAVLTCLIFFPQERFRIPILDPVLIVCAAALADRRGRPRAATELEGRSFSPVVGG